MTILKWIAAGVALIIGLLIAGRISMRRELAAKANGTFAKRYVYINDDGSVRELTPEEANYLSMDFHPADGARPYIKFRYQSLTPDGRISGFLRRSQVPRSATWTTWKPS
jgi:hypothetical protein